MKNLILKALVVTVAVSASFTSFAHNKVVVIPLFGDEAPPTPTFKKVFWTNTTYTGNLGGLSGADEKCQAAADAETIKGTYKAWLGVSSGYGAIPGRPAFSFHDLPYRNVDGTNIASSFVDFLDGVFSGNIKSQSGSNSIWPYWTGLDSGGAQIFAMCSEWTSQSVGWLGATGDPYGGIQPSVDWSFEHTVPCSTYNSLLCFEQ